MPGYESPCTEFKQVRCGMSFLQFLIDDMCANFTVEAISELARRRLAKGPCEVNDLAVEIAGKDHTLDMKSAQILAQAAVDFLGKKGEITVSGTSISSRH